MSSSRLSRYNMKLVYIIMVVIMGLVLLCPGGGSGAVVKAACLESRRSRRPRFDIQDSKKQNVSSLLTRKDSIPYQQQHSDGINRFLMLNVGTVSQTVDHDELSVASSFSLCVGLIMLI